MPTWAGFIFLAIVVDVWGRRIVGWSIGESMSAELVVSALNMALVTRKPRNVVRHSDQGGQYAGTMGSVGDAYDNAMVESVFASLEWAYARHLSGDPPSPSRRYRRLIALPLDVVCIRAGSLLWSQTTRSRSTSYRRRNC